MDDLPDGPAGPDGERYLRLLLEDAMAADQAQDRAGPAGSFHGAAQVLVAAGAVDPAVATELEWELSLACSLRAHAGTPGGLALPVRLWPADYPAGRPGPGPSVTLAALEPAAVAAGPATFEMDEGTVTVVFITTGPGGRVQVAVRDADADARHPRPELMSAIHAVRVTDDEGTVYHPGGGGGGGHHGSWTFDHALIPEPPITARWFDLAGPSGRTFRLPVHPPPAQPTATRPPRRTRAEVTLLEAIVTFGARAAESGAGFGLLAAAADTLVGAGVLPPTHPLLGQAALIAQGPPTPAGLDPRLASALRPQPEGPGPSGLLSRCQPVGVVMRSEAASLAAEALTVLDGAVELHGRIEPWQANAQLPFAVLGHDDLDQWYLGYPTSMGPPGSGPAHITVRFAPRLDPAASGFVIVIVTPEGETDVTVPLR